MNDLKNNFLNFVDTIASLRDSKTGCPWDLKQTHHTLKKYMIEEAYEAVSAVGNPKEFCEELGDVLLQVVLNAQIAKDQNEFDITDVIKSIDQKMRRRHPHVFCPKGQKTDDASLHKQWDEIKKEEGKDSKNCDGFPSTIAAQKIGKSAYDFDWPDLSEVYKNFLSEVSELSAEIKKEDNLAKIEDEVGDIYFSLAQVCRHLGIDAEVTAHAGNVKFQGRYHEFLKLIEGDNKNLSDLSDGEKSGYWEKVKCFRKDSKKG